jgi:hypothetical protein
LAGAVIVGAGIEVLPGTEVEVGTDRVAVGADWVTVGKTVLAGDRVSMTVGLGVAVPVEGCSIPTSIVPLQAVMKRRIRSGERMRDFMEPPDLDWICSIL